MIPFEHIPQSPTYFWSSTHTKMNDMRLLHHFCTVTMETLGFSIQDKAIDVWKKAVPELAFKHEFLMDNLLAIASIHIDLLNPRLADYRTTAIYRDKAFKTYRKAIANLSGHNFSAVLVVAVLMSLSALVANPDADDGELRSAGWLDLHTGVGALLDNVALEEVIESSVAPIFNVQKFMPVSTYVLIPSMLQKMLDSIDDDDQDTPCREILAQTAIALGKVYGRIVFDASDTATAFAIMCWPYMIPKAFIELAKQKRPRALVILAHYFVFFDILPQCWWTIGVARQQVDAISIVLSSEWQSFLVTPKMAVLMNDKDRVLELLLNQFPAMDPTNPVPLEPFF
jgi:Fungal specific transcription factor domain